MLDYKVQASCSVNGANTTGNEAIIPILSEISPDRSNLFTVLSDFSIAAISLEEAGRFNQGAFCKLSGHKDRVRAIKPCPTSGDGHILYTASDDGFCFAYDLRKGTSPVFNLASSFSNRATSTVGISSVEVGFNGNIVALGTDSFLEKDSEGYSEDCAHINFFDVRGRRKLGTLTSAHSGSVTALHFNGQSSEILSVGQDGLACVADLTQANEDDSLTTVINIEEPVERANFFGPQNQCIWCLSSSNSVSLYQLETAEKMVSFSFTDFVPETSSQNEDIWTPIDCTYVESPSNQHLFCFFGDSNGSLVLNEVNLNGIHQKSNFLKQHSENISNISVVSTREDVIQSFVSCSDDSFVKLWSIS